MKKTSLKPGLPLSLSIEIPTTWTPEQVVAVFDLLSDIRERIWNQYNVEIQTELQNQLRCDDQQ